MDPPLRAGNDLDQPRSFFMAAVSSSLACFPSTFPLRAPMTGPMRGPMAPMPLDLTKSARSLTICSITLAASSESMASRPSFLIASSAEVPTAISLRSAGSASFAKRPSFSMANTPRMASSENAPTSMPSCSSSP